MAVMMGCKRCSNKIDVNLYLTTDVKSFSMTTTGTKEKIGWIVQCHQDYLTYYIRKNPKGKQTAAIHKYLLSLIVNVPSFMLDEMTWQYMQQNSLYF